MLLFCVLLPVGLSLVGCDSSGSNSDSNSGEPGYAGVWFSTEAGNDTGDTDQNAYLDITESTIESYVIEGGNCNVFSAGIESYDEESNIMEFEPTFRTPAPGGTDMLLSITLYK